MMYSRVHVARASLAHLGFVNLRQDSESVKGGVAHSFAPIADHRYHLVDRRLHLELRAGKRDEGED